MWHISTTNNKKKLISTIWCSCTRQHSNSQNGPELAQSEIRRERPPDGFLSIDGVFEDKIQIDGKKYKHSLFVCPQFVVQWMPTSLEQITPESFALATVHYPSIRHVFVGVGYTLPCPTPPEWISYLAKYRITCEILTFATACRLFNSQNTLTQDFAVALLYEPHVVARLHSLARKVDLGMPDPDPLAN